MLGLLAAGILSAIRKYTKIGRARAIFESALDYLNQLASIDGNPDSSDVVAAAKRVADNSTTIDSTVPQAMHEGSHKDYRGNQDGISTVADRVLNTDVPDFHARLEMAWDDNGAAVMADADVTTVLDNIDATTAADTTNWPVWEDINRGNETNTDPDTFFEHDDATVGMKALFLAEVTNLKGWSA